MAHIQVFLEKSVQEVMYSSKKNNYNYMEFVGYDTCDKLIWESGEGIIITNETRKQGVPKTHISKISISSALGFH